MRVCSLVLNIISLRWKTSHYTLSQNVNNVLKSQVNNYTTSSGILNSKVSLDEIDSVLIRSYLDAESSKSLSAALVLYYRWASA